MVKLSVAKDVKTHYIDLSPTISEECGEPLRDTEEWAFANGSR